MAWEKGTVSAVNIDCPKCGHHFNPLPPPPNIPTGPEPTMTLPVAKFGMTALLLKQLAEKSRRDGFHAHFTEDRATQSVTLTIAIPEMHTLTDDATLPNA